MKSEKYLTLNIFNAFSYIGSDSDMQVVIMDSLFLALETGYTNPVPRMNRWISKMGKSWPNSLQLNRKLIISAKKPGENAHWGLIGLEIVSQEIERIFRMNSALSLNLLVSQLNTAKLWAENLKLMQILGLDRRYGGISNRNL